MLISIIFSNQASNNSIRAIKNLSTAQAASTQAIAHQVIAQAASTQAVIEANIRATAQLQANSESAINRSLALAQAAQHASEDGQGDLAIALALEAVKGDQPPLEAVQALRHVTSSPGIRLMLIGHQMKVKAVDIVQMINWPFQAAVLKLMPKVVANQVI